MFHRRLDAKSLARGAGRKDLKTRVWCGRKGTTRYRCGTKKSSTFCVFLLTDILHPPILRIQIRGNVEAPGGPSRGLMGPRDKTHATSPGFKRKKRARSEASHWHLRSGEPAVRLSIVSRPMAGHCFCRLRELRLAGAWSRPVF